MRRSPEEITAARDRLLYELVGTDWQKTAALGSYGDLRALEERGLVESRKVPGDNKLYFCVVCEQVLTAETLQCLKGRSRHDLRPFWPQVKEWRLTELGVRARRQAA